MVLIYVCIYQESAVTCCCNVTLLSFVPFYTDVCICRSSTLAFEPTRFKNGEPSRGWLDGLLKRLQLALRKGQDLDSGKCKLTKDDLMAWHSSVGASINEVDSTILSDPSRIFNADETGIVLDPSPNKVGSTRFTHFLEGWGRDGVDCHDMGLRIHFFTFFGVTF